MIQQLLNIDNNNKKIDVILMNPPFSKDLHLDFFDKALDISNKVVIIEPGQWLIQLKENGKYTKQDSKSVNIQKKIEGHVKSIEFNNYNKELNIANKTVCSISCIDFIKDYNEIDFECITEKSKVKSLKDCNLIGERRLVDSILNKCKSYKDHMIDHCINLKKYKEYENKGYYFIPYGNYMINNLGSNQGYFDKMYSKNNLGTFYNCFTSVTGLDSKITYNEVPKGIRRGSPFDCIYFETEKEAENWKYNGEHNNIVIFVNICLTIDEHNNSREYIPWLVDKKYTNEEIYKLLDITEEEQELIDKTIKKFDINTNWCKKLLNNEIKHRKQYK